MVLLCTKLQHPKKNTESGSYFVSDFNGKGPQSLEDLQELIKKIRLTGLTRFSISQGKLRAPQDIGDSNEAKFTRG